MTPTKKSSLVSTTEVEQVAVLARVQLQGEELTRLAAQLDEILRYVQQLQAVATDAVEPTSHVLPLTNITRADAVRPSVAAEDLLVLAPERHGQLVKVPKIIETEA